MQFIKQCGVLPSAGLYLLVQPAMEVNKLFMTTCIYMLESSSLSSSGTCDRSVVFSGYSVFPPPIKTDHHDITEILLKMALNTINHQPTSFIFRSNLIFYRYSQEWGSRLHDIRSLPQCGVLLYAGLYLHVQLEWRIGGCGV